jgi:hypothetical protein
MMEQGEYCSQRYLFPSLVKGDFLNHDMEQGEYCSQRYLFPSLVRGDFLNHAGIGKILSRPGVKQNMARDDMGSKEEHWRG